MFNPSTENNLFIICPNSLWSKLSQNLQKLPFEVVRYQPSSLSYQRIATSLAELEVATWSLPNPPFTRSNFGLFGPGVIIGVEEKGKVIASMYFLCPSLYDKNAHIWNIIVHPTHRRKGLSQILLTTTMVALCKIAKTVSYQTKSNSNSLYLYSKYGPSKIIYVHNHDTNDNWITPKIGLETPVPYKINNDKSLELVSKKIKVKHKAIMVATNSHFWKNLSTVTNLWGRLLFTDVFSDDTQSQTMLGVAGMDAEAHQFILANQKKNSKTFLSQIA